MKTLKALVIGLCRMALILLLLPILAPLMMFDMVLWIGGMDPFNTPVRKLLDKFDWIL